MSTIDVIPGHSIGTISVGMRESDLPKGASLSGPVGQVDGVQFLVLDGIVVDAWIDDLRTYRHAVRYNGTILDPHASLIDLQKIFGPCQPVPGVKGGTFFNCGAGITLGSDPDARGDFIQLRLKAR
jgi:hypothetical protein